MGAVLEIKDFRKGASRQAIAKYISVNFNRVVQNPALRKALGKLVADGSLTQDGQRFKLVKEKRAELRKPAPKPRKKKKKVVKKKTKKTKKKKQPRKKQKKQPRKRKKKKKS